MEFTNAIKVYRKSGGSPTIAFTESITEPIVKRAYLTARTSRTSTVCDPEN
jgi:hypothetical protein